MPITITEALATIKTIDKRIAKKNEYIRAFATRQDGYKDPLATDGGSFNVIQREQQAIGDLENEKIRLRRGIAVVNDETDLTIQGTTRSVAEWLIWRREVAPNAQQRLNGLRQVITVARNEAKKNGLTVVGPGSVAEKPSDLHVNVNEAKLAGEIEQLETTLGELDGALSLKNATVTIAEIL